MSYKLLRNGLSNNSAIVLKKEIQIFQKNLKLHLIKYIIKKNNMITSTKYNEDFPI